MGSKAELLEKIAKKQAIQGDAAGALAWAGALRLPKAKLHALRGLADGVVQQVAAGTSTSSGAVGTPKVAK